MTGFGRGLAEGTLGRVAVELKSVNSRHREIFATLPRDLLALEIRLKSFLKEAIERGKLDCRVVFEPAAASVPLPRVNDELVARYAERLRETARRAGLPEAVSLDTLLRLPGAVDPPSEDRDPDVFWPLVEAAALDAIAKLRADRDREGESLAAALRVELATLRAFRERLHGAKDSVAARYRERLAARVEELQTKIGVKLDPSRLEMEVAMHADRCAIDEELVRLASHLDRFQALLDSPRTEPIGRQLDFLFQEILRETNTIGSKAHDLELSQSILDMKASIERAREQIQNVE